MEHALNKQQTDFYFTTALRRDGFQSLRPAGGCLVTSLVTD